MKDKYIPYGFDLNYQYEMYKNIGKRYKEQFSEKNNIISKLKMYIRERFNKENKKYKNFDTFSQWENYIVKMVNEYNYVNHSDFEHYLQKKKDLQESWLNIYEVIATPVYIGLISMGVTVYSSIGIPPLVTILFTSVLLLFVLIFLMIKCSSNRKKINFYRDVIDILKEN